MPGNYTTEETAQAAADAATAALDAQQVERGTRFEVEERQLSPH